MIRKYYQYFHSRSDLQQVLLLSCAFSVALALFRVAYTGETMFLWLNWNLFLAFLPFAITTLLLRHVAWIHRTYRFLPVFVAWLLLLPNSFYILTDLFHLRNRPGMPQWYDLALILSFAWNGLLLGVASMRVMEKITATKWNIPEEGFVLLVMLFNALGVYIGRYLRFNSWDVLVDPFALASEMFHLFLHPLQNRFEWSMIICYTMLLSLMYAGIKKLARA